VSLSARRAPIQHLNEFTSKWSQRHPGELARERRRRSLAGCHSCEKGPDGGGISKLTRNKNDIRIFNIRINISLLSRNHKDNCVVFRGLPEESCCSSH
jgi:hypothetical protein